MITFESLKDLEILDNTPLGEGAFSFVYKVRHRRDGNTYAMKKIDILQLSKADCENLKLEIKLHQSLVHQNIIRFFGCIQRKNLVYMLLEHASNGSLFFYIDIQEGLPEILALRFFYETAVGIRYLHRQNIVHRDIKPENILLDKDFQIKVCDFGWSCNIEGDDVRSSICGTYEYMSPEIVNEESHNFGVDIWCLGILLYEMLHGNPPFHAENLTEIKQEFKRKHIKIADNFDEDTKDLIEKLLDYNPSTRISIDEALSHRAIRKNMKHIRRKLTQEEYKLLIRYYYMNSGGNQLVTHNSTYARHLKRQSMMTKTSQNSYKSTDSDFFERESSHFKPSQFFNSDSGRRDNSNGDPLNGKKKGFAKNDFEPVEFDGGDRRGSTPQMTEEFLSQAFKKKGNLGGGEKKVVESGSDKQISDSGFKFDKKDKDLGKVDIKSMFDQLKITASKNEGNNNGESNYDQPLISANRNPDSNRNISKGTTNGNVNSTPNKVYISSNNDNRNSNHKGSIKRGVEHLPTNRYPHSRFLSANSQRVSDSGKFSRVKSKSPVKEQLVVISERRNQSFDIGKLPKNNYSAMNILSGGGNAKKKHTTLKEFQKQYDANKFYQKYQNQGQARAGQTYHNRNFNRKHSEYGNAGSKFSNVKRLGNRDDVKGDADNANVGNSSSRNNNNASNFPSKSSSSLQLKSISLVSKVDNNKKINDNDNNNSNLKPQISQNRAVRADSQKRHQTTATNQSNPSNDYNNSSSNRLRPNNRDSNGQSRSSRTMTSTPQTNPSLNYRKLSPAFVNKKPDGVRTIITTRTINSPPPLHSNKLKEESSSSKHNKSDRKDRAANQINEAKDAGEINVSFDRRSGYDKGGLSGKSSERQNQRLSLANVNSANSSNNNVSSINRNSLGNNNYNNNTINNAHNNNLHVNSVNRNSIGDKSHADPNTSSSIGGSGPTGEVHSKVIKPNYSLNNLYQNNVGNQAGLNNTSFTSVSNNLTPLYKSNVSHSNYNENRDIVSKTTKGYPSRIIETSGCKQVNDARSHNLGTNPVQGKRGMFVNYKFDAYQKAEEPEWGSENVQRFSEQVRRKTWDRARANSTQNDAHQANPKRDISSESIPISINRVKQAKDKPNPNKNNDDDDNNNGKEYVKKLSHIYEEPVSSEVSMRNTMEKKGLSLFEQIKNYQANLPERQSQGRREQTESGAKKRSESSEGHFHKRGKGAEEDVVRSFTRRVVFVNGVKTEKLIFSKSNIESARGSEKRNYRNNEHASQQNLFSKETPKPEIKDPNSTKKQTTTEESESQSDISKPELKEEKKKYKVFTVPLKDARVIQEGGQRFSNIKPITIIQQGNFAFPKPPTQNLKLKSNSTNKPETPKGGTEKVRFEESGKRDPTTLQSSNSTPKLTRVLSLDEYRKQTRDRINESERAKHSLNANNSNIANTPAYIININTGTGAKIDLLDVISAPKGKGSSRIIEQYKKIYQEESYEVFGRKVFQLNENTEETGVKGDGPVIRKLTRTMSKPVLKRPLEKGRQQNKSFNRLAHNKSFEGGKFAETLNANRLERVFNNTAVSIHNNNSNNNNNNNNYLNLHGANANNRNAGSNVNKFNKNKTYDGSHIKDILRDVNREEPRNTDPIATQKNVESKMFGHKKTNTMFSLNQQKGGEQQTLLGGVSGKKTDRGSDKVKRSHQKTIKYLKGNREQGNNAGGSGFSNRNFGSSSNRQSNPKPVETTQNSISQTRSTKDNYIPSSANQPLSRPFKSNTQQTSWSTTQVKNPPFNTTKSVITDNQKTLKKPNAKNNNNTNNTNNTNNNNFSKTVFSNQYSLNNSASTSQQRIPNIVSDRLSYGKRTTHLKQSHSAKIMNPQHSNHPRSTNYSHLQSSSNPKFIKSLKLNNNNSNNININININNGDHGGASKKGQINGSFNSQRFANRHQTVSSNYKNSRLFNHSQDKVMVRRYTVNPKAGGNYRTEEASGGKGLGVSKGSIFKSFNELKKKELKSNYFGKQSRNGAIQESRME